MAAAMAAKAVAKKRAGGKFKPTPFVAPELPWRTKPEVEKKSWSSRMVLKMQPLWTPQCGTKLNTYKYKKAWSGDQI